jgi:hypothetical protein
VVKEVADRNIDMLVAEKFFGWKWVEMPDEAKREIMNPALCGRRLLPPDDDQWDVHDIVPHYSTSIADAWEVFDDLRGRLLDHEEIELRYVAFNGEWQVDSAEICISADSAPLAICMAALQVAGVK